MKGHICGLLEISVILTFTARMFKLCMMNAAATPYAVGLIVLNLTLFICSVISDMFQPVLRHLQGNYSCTALGITVGFKYVPNM
jgi:hypothetical protein